MKTVLITGSTSGLGLGVAIEFAKAGYNIIFNGLEKEGPKIAADVSKKYNVGTLYSAANMLKPEEIIEMVNQGIAKFGGIDVLINNAGIQFVSPIEEFPSEKWNDIIAINLSSAFHASKAVWSNMKARKFGRIINISSVHGLVASEYKSAYVSAKHGVIGLTKVLALEGATVGITANSICPGYVKTPLVEKQIKDQAKSHNIPEYEVINKIMLVKHAIKDFVSVEALGALALFLASDNASMITGTAIPMDGGWSAA
jgi:3-hydroxybutyrate dehydrogenase